MRIGLAIFLATLPFSTAWGADPRPNIVLIMTDNHGAWTLGCYGNKDIRTPHIDRLAKEGTLFERAFSSNAVCSPARATFLTGLLPSQHGVHCYLRANEAQMGPKAYSTIAEFRSLPEILNENGYTCGLSGKWHLGKNMTPQEGFSFWTTTPHGATREFYNQPVIENGKVRKEPTYLTDYWTKRGVEFIEKNREKPFFLFLSYNGPYGLGRSLLNKSRNRHANYYADKELKSFPREKPHEWLHNNRDYINNPISIRRFASELSAVDDGVGEIMATLKKHDLDENTLVIFVADQGWVGGHGGFWGMGDHTRPLTAFDGMMRIPLIARHPGKVPANVRLRNMVSNYDLMPTVLTHVGLEDKAPKDWKSPGRSFAAMLRGKELPGVDWKNEVFYEFENVRAIRTAEWKFVKRFNQRPNELYNLKDDPDERKNLVNHLNQKNALKLHELDSRLFLFFNKFADPKYDLWQGGKSKTKLLTQNIFATAPKNPPTPQPTQLAPRSSAEFKPPVIKVPDGFTVEMVAAPPLVQHPVMAGFDDRGRLFVAENAGVNLKKAELEKQKPSSLRVLEDTNGDGRFDKSTIFADKMTFPQGALWHEGALFVASPPGIWRLEDTDNDGKADKREMIVGGFEYTGNAADIHGPFLHPNGRIYWCHGRKGHEVRQKDGMLVSKGKGARIWSSNPDGTDIQVHCGGGMDNPTELCFTADGDILGTVPLLYAKPRRDALVHWVYGGVYPRRDQGQVLAEFKRTGDLLEHIVELGHVAPAGVMRYRSGQFGKGYRDNIFLCEFNTHRVTRVKLDLDGSSYRGEAGPFLTSPNNDVHFTDILEDADGSLIVIDTGGWFRIGCPTSKIAKPNIRGAIYRIRKTGAKPVDDPRGNRIDWAKIGPTEFRKLMKDERFAVRDRALAVYRQKQKQFSQPVLKNGHPNFSPLMRYNQVVDELIGEENVTAQLAAVWAAARTHNSDLLVNALDHPSEQVRKAAMFAISTVQLRAVVLITGELHKDLNGPPSIRRTAAASIGRLLAWNPAYADSIRFQDMRTAAVRALLQAMAQPDNDRMSEHAIIYALIQIADPAATATGLNHANANVRRAALVAIDQMIDGRLTGDQVVAQLDFGNSRLERAAIEIITGRGWGDQIVERLAKWMGPDQWNDEHAPLVRGALTAFIGNSKVQALVASAIGSTETPQILKLLVLDSIAQSHHPSMPDSWRAPMRGLLGSDSDPIVIATCRAIAATATDEFDPALRRIQTDQNRAPGVRLATIRARVKRLKASDTAMFIFLTEQLKARDPMIRLRTARILESVPLDDQQKRMLKKYLSKASPMIARSLSHAMGVKMPTVNSVEQISRLKMIERSLTPGDPQRGRAIFRSSRTSCFICHRVGDSGGRVGPDLSTVGRIRNRRDLLEAIVFPSASIARGYETVSVSTLEGDHVGVIARHTTDAIFLIDATASETRVARDEIELIKPVELSIMPQGFDKAMTPREISDVIAYLMSLK